MNAGFIVLGGIRGRGGMAKEIGMLPQGAWLVLKSCRAAGHEVHDLEREWRTTDVVMASIYWWEHVYDLVERLAALGIDYRRESRAERPFVFLGGATVSGNPGIVRDIADAVCVGDGEDVGPAALTAIASGARGAQLAAMVPGLYVSAADNLTEWQHTTDITGTIRWPYGGGLGECRPSGARQGKSLGRRIEVARGCRAKCLYCGVSWTKRYREVPAGAVAEAVRQTGGAIKAFAPNPVAHSGWSAIDGALQEAGKTNNAKDLSARALLSGKADLSRVGTATFGIDGLSERVRRAFAKPLSRAELIEVICRTAPHMARAGVYLIIDAPGERDADAEEWFATLLDAERAVQGVKHRGRYWVTVTLNTFLPTPHSPLQWAGISLAEKPDRAYLAAQRRLFPQDDARTIRHKMMVSARGPVNRLLDVAVVRGAPELAPWVWTVAANRGRLDRGTAGIDTLFRVAVKLGVRDALDRSAAEHSTDRPAPWELRVRPLFPREALLRGWQTYRRRMGLPTTDASRETVLPSNHAR